MSYSESAKRSNLVHTLALMWLKINRPDMLLACREEALKRIPSDKARKKSLALPESLMNLK